MAKYTHDVIIIGGGAGGLVATVGCSRLGLKTAVIEKHSGLGGDCLFYGCVPSKTLLKSASVYRYAKSFPKYGLPSPQLAKPNLATVNKRVQSVINTIAKHDAPSRFEKMGAEVHTATEAQFVSEHEVSLGGKKTISAPKIVIATGTRPLVLPIEGIEDAGYITNIDVFSMKKLPDHLIIVGAGPIGVEMSQVFSRLGSKVTMIEIADRILINDDRDMSEVVLNNITADGVNCICNAKILHARAKGGKKGHNLPKGRSDQSGSRRSYSVGRRQKGQCRLVALRKRRRRDDAQLCADKQ